MRNYGIRYPIEPDNNEYNSENNYGAWIPPNKIELFIIEDERLNHKGLGKHEFIPKDYVPKMK